MLSVFDSSLLRDPCLQEYLLESSRDPERKRALQAKTKAGAGAGRFGMRKKETKKATDLESLTQVTTARCQRLNGGTGGARTVPCRPKATEIGDVLSRSSQVLALLAISPLSGWSCPFGSPLSACIRLCQCQSACARKLTEGDRGMCAQGDFANKLLHLAWHPEANVIACAAANSLYLLCTTKP